MEETAGLIIRTARAAAGVSQYELAKRAGIPQNRLSEIERGRRRPKADVARRVWDALVLPGGEGANDAPAA